MTQLEATHLLNILIPNLKNIDIMFVEINET